MNPVLAQAAWRAKISGTSTDNKIIRDLQDRVVKQRMEISVLKEEVIRLREKLHIAVEWGGWPAGSPAALRNVIEVVAEHYGIGPGDILGRYQGWEVCRPRQTAYYIIRKMSLASIATIKRAFKRDHSTVCHGVKTAKKRIESDPALQADVDAIISKIRRLPDV